MSQLIVLPLNKLWAYVLQLEETFRQHCAQVNISNTNYITQLLLIIMSYLIIIMTPTFLQETSRLNRQTNNYSKYLNGKTNLSNRLIQLKTASPKMVVPDHRMK